MAGQGREKRGGEKQEKGVANNILTDWIYNDAKRDVLVTAGVQAGRQACWGSELCAVGGGGGTACNPHQPVAAPHCMLIC